MSITKKTNDPKVFKLGITTLGYVVWFWVQRSRSGLRLGLTSMGRVFELYTSAFWFIHLFYNTLMAVNGLLSADVLLKRCLWVGKIGDFYS